jgi:hypothetical protein
MSQKAFVAKSLLMLLLVTDSTLLLCQFTNTSYDIVSVTPLFFLCFADYLFPLSIILALLGILSSLMAKDRVLFTFSSLTLYFIIFLAPYNIFRFPIYNDQLDFAVEALYGMHYGVIVPYGGEYSTLGHAFFTSIAGEILGLNLFQATRFVEVVFVVVCFVVYLSLATPILKGQGGRNLLAATVVLIFPAFALESLVYSRGYFGLIISTFLFFCMLKFMKERSAKSFILITIIFVTSSISYPLQPLVVVISMALLALPLRFVASSNGNEHEFRRATLKTLVFFLIWSAIQVYLGYASWSILHEIIWKALIQEFFTGFKQPALRYVGEAAVYTSLRILMIATGWLMAAFILLVFILSFLRNRNFSSAELFTFSLIASFCFLGIVYGITFHEPALNFYRNLIATLPFALTCMSKIAVRESSQREIQAFLLAITITFLILSPVTKWGWTFVAYPTEQDIALSNHIVSNCGFSPNSVLYAPGSHCLLDVFSFKVKAMQTGFSTPEVYSPGDVDFDISKAMKADYTATFYRMFIYPHWYGVDMNVRIIEIITFASKNNLLYNNGGLWLLIEKKP